MLLKPAHYPTEESQLKNVLSIIVAALVSLSFSAVVFAADTPAAPAVATAVEKKEANPPKECNKNCKKAKKCKKTKKCDCKPECAKKNEKKEDTPVAPAAK
jgi:mannitol-specific phosphotransferase system IIBC component